MSRPTPHRVRHHVKKQVLFLSRTTLNIWHRCHTRALPHGKRFSLMSPSGADHQATFAAQHVRNNLHHLSASSEQIFGFHVVCPRCEGFVVRDGVVRNCEHVRESWCSGLSDRSSRGIGRGGAGKVDNTAQGTDDVRISVQPPTPVASPEPDTSGNGQGSAEHDSRDADTDHEGRLVKPKALQPVPTILRPGPVKADDGARRRRSANVKVLESVPTILRPGRAARTKEATRKAIESGASPPSKHARKTRTTAEDGPHISTSASSPADTSLVDRERSVQSLAKPDALMQNWKKWSESWEKSVTRVNSGAKNNYSATKPHCGPDSLMQEWREWSMRWERSVTSR